MALLGMVVGSFAGATVWRLRAKQLVADKLEGEVVDGAELRRLKPLAEAPFGRNDRSRCLHCGHELSWRDLVPLVSWLSAKGRCRYCKTSIGRFEPTIELGSALLFIVFALHWTQIYTPPEAWMVLIGWIVALTCLVVLFAYDQKWFLLPDAVMWPFIGISGVIALFNITTSTRPLEASVATLGAVIILAGLYFALWFVSKGQWVGFGDVKLGLGLALLLGSWQLALIALFMANLIGTLLVLPGLVTGKLDRKTHIPFGPLLILGFFVALFFGLELMNAFYGLVANTLMLY